MGMTR